MKTNNRKYLATIFFTCFVCFIALESKAQFSDINYFARRTPMSYKMNPAMLPSAKCYWNLPFISSFNMSFATSGFAYNDLITRRSDDSLVMDLNNFYDKLTQTNSLNMESNTELFGLGFNVGKRSYLAFGLDLSIDASAEFSKDVIGLIMNGINTADQNRDIINGKIVSLNAYLTPSITYTQGIGDKWTAGVRLKFPMGIANVSTEKSKFTLDYSGSNVTAISDILIHTSIIAGKVQFSGLDNNDTKFEKTEGASNILSNAMKNKGFAVDLGLTYKPTEKSMFSVAVQDWGSINWKANPTDIVSKNPGASYEFNGLGVMNLINKDSLSVGDRLEQIKDSLINMLDLHTQDVSSYKVKMPTKLYFAYSYNFAKHNFVNALYKITMGDGYTNHRWSLFWALETGKHINISLGNTFAYYSASSHFSGWNPSVLFDICGGGFNLYAGGGFSSSMNVAKTSGFSAYAGMNFTWGYNDEWKYKSTKVAATAPSAGTALEKKTEKEQLQQDSLQLQDEQKKFEENLIRYDNDTLKLDNDTLKLDSKVQKYDWDTVSFDDDTVKYDWDTVHFEDQQVEPKQDSVLQSTPQSIEATDKEDSTLPVNNSQSNEQKATPLQVQPIGIPSIAEEDDKQTM